MRKMLTAGVAALGLTAVALVPLQAMGSTPESTTPVVAATQSYDRQMAQERASRDKVRESVEKHQKAKNVAKAKAEKEREAKVEAARLKQEKLDKAWLAYLAEKEKREAAAKVVAAEAKKKEEKAKIVQRVYTPKKTTKTYTPEPTKTYTPEPKKTYTPDPPKQASYGSPKAYAQSQLSSSQFACLDLLWMKESGWNVYANNPSSGAYGIPQSLPGSKMASAGSDWRTNGITQVKWGLSYISSVYGTPCSAWGHSQAVNWY